MSLQRRRSKRFLILHMWRLLNPIANNDVKGLIYTPFSFRESGKKCQSLLNILWRSIGPNSKIVNSFAVMRPTLWNCISYQLIVIADKESFKSYLTKFFMTIPYTPLVWGYTPSNSNSILCWRSKKNPSTSWNGRPGRLYWKWRKDNKGN